MTRKIFPLLFSRELGNVGSGFAADHAAACAKAGVKERVRPGAKVALLGIGSGLSCQMAALQW